MHLVKDIGETRALLRRWKREGLTLGFVPTMGYLHAGHLSLVARARRENDRVAASVFVNPTQFGPQEDLERYPRDEVGDRRKLGEAGVDLLFMPAAGAIYPPGFQTFIDVERVSRPLCGRSRPGHFRGVATVVAKLLNIVKPDRAYFGAKDYQQTVVIRTMTRDLNLDTEIVACPTVREPDGLAMSSRNAYLSPEDRRAASVLFRALSQACGALESGAVSPATPSALAGIIEGIIAREPRARLDYAEVLRADTLEPASSLNEPLLLALAVHIGSTRLIDNMVVGISDEGLRHQHVE